MTEKFIAFIRENQLVGEGQKILLAVSGGMDSMAMLELFCESGYEVGVAHCNFYLRGKESDDDEAFVREVTRGKRLPFYSKAFDTLAFAGENGISVQMAARDLRYEYFRQIAQEHGYGLIATAHHLDDQTETFFINLSRGSGIAGFHGIRPKNGKLIRPLMFAHREEIEAYVRNNSIPYREDSSNSSLKYIRNKIRHQIIPLMRDLNPAFDSEIERTITHLSQTEEIFREYIARRKTELFEEHDGSVLLDIDKVKALPAPNTFLYELIAEFGFNKNDVVSILQSIGKDPGRQFFSATHRLVVDRKKMIIVPVEHSADEQRTHWIEAGTGEISVPVKLRFSSHKRSSHKISADKSKASLDLDKLVFPLTLRRWREGDAFIPLGMTNHKKLSDFFIDGKYSLIQKENCWLLCSGDDIVWVVGDRIDDRFKVTEATEAVLEVSMVR